MKSTKFNQPVVHKPIGESNMTLCGIVTPNIRGVVTCKRCLKKMEGNKT